MNYKMKHFYLLALSLSFYFLQGQNPLFIPDTLSGVNFTLNIVDSSKVFYNTYTTSTYGINSNYLAPTLILKKNDSISLLVKNKLTDTTTVHWHGLHVASSNDGGPHTPIPPNTNWNPKFRIRDWAGTYWYHPHLHEMTNEQVTKGAAGLIIIRDSVENALTLPRKYGVDDFPIIIQSKAFDSNKQITIGNSHDSVIMVNGTIKPYLNVPAQIVRLRILNASSNRVYNLGLTGNLPFKQIASDGGLLSNPVNLTRLRIAPGERAEILLNLVGMQSQTINLISFASEFSNGIYGASNPSAMGPGSIAGYAGNTLNGANFTILKLNVVAQTINPVVTTPTLLSTHAIFNTNSAAITRSLTFSPKTQGPNQMVNGPFVINNQSFNMNVVNYNVPINNIEIWQLTNQTAIAHPFHIHDVQFYVFEINGSAPPLNQMGRKDVILVPSQQTVKFITKFERFCDTVPYMYHCHMLPHEDEGMMGQFKVTCATTGLYEDKINNSILVFPNPSSNYVKLQSKENLPLEKVKITDPYGRQIFTKVIEKSEDELNLTLLPEGLYFIEVFYNKKKETIKLIKQ